MILSRIDASSPTLHRTAASHHACARTDAIRQGQGRRRPRPHAPMTDQAGTVLMSCCSSSTNDAQALLERLCRSRSERIHCCDIRVWDMPPYGVRACTQQRAAAGSVATDFGFRDSFRDFVDPDAALHECAQRLSWTHLNLNVNVYRSHYPPIASEPPWPEPRSSRSD